MNRRRLLLIPAALLVLGVALLLALRSRPSHEVPADQAAPSAGAPGRPLRLDRLLVEARPLPLSSLRTGRTTQATAAAPLQPLPSRGTPAPAPGSSSRPSTSANFEIGREEVLKERDGVFGYNSRFYGATFEAGSVEVATGLVLKDIGRPRFSYALEEVRAGDQILCTGGTVGAQADPAARTLSYVRGSVEERYILSKESLEQIFVVRELPERRGEISVTGRVATNLTPPRDGTSGETLSFIYRERELLSVSKAVAIDASGRRKDLDLAYSAGRMTMTVPAEWVAAASLPITIDPVIGGPVVVDNHLTDFVDTVNGQFVRICDAAYSSASGRWLATWAEPFGASAFNYDLFSQAVDASGASVGSPLPIGTSTGGDYESTIASSPSGGFLVAWRHDPLDDGSDSDQVILGRVVNADGTFAGGAFTLDDLPGQDYGPSLAFGGGQWLCVFTNIPSAGNSDVRGRFVSPAGVPGTAVDLDLDADLASRPSLAFSSTSFVVAWEKGPAGGPFSAVARAVDSGGALTTPITEVDAGTNDATFVDVSAGSGNVLIVWQVRVTPSNLNVLGRIADPSLTFATPPFTLNAGLTDQVTPRAARSELNNEWLVVYSDPITGGQDVYANRVSTTGSVFAAEKVTTGGQADRRPELAWNSITNEMLIVYLFKTNDPYQVRARRFSMDYVAPTIPGTPVAAPNPNPTGTHTVSWAPSTDTGGSGLAGYDLQRSSDSGTTYVIVASPTGTSFTEVGLPFGTYLYRVRARDTAGNASAYSAPSDPVVVGGAAPVAPSNLAGAAQAPDSILWTWTDASSDETGFRLKDENGVTRVDSIPADATSALETGLFPNTGYSRRAFAFNTSGQSAGSNLASTSTLLAPPTQADFSVTAARWDQVQINVVPPPNSTELLTGVRVERSPDGGAWELVQDFAPLYSVLDSGRSQNATYFYRITFQNRAGVPTASSLANSVATPAMPGPVITSPVGGVLLGTRTPSVSGTSAIAGLTISLFVEGFANGSTTSGAGGSWSLTPPTPVLDGQRSFTARASDAFGNASPHSTAVLVTIDATPPLITSPTPANGSTTGNLRPTISASWSDTVSGIVPGTAVIFLDAVNITAQCTVTPTGFSHAPATDLSQGGHSVSAQVADAAGNAGLLQWTFTVLPADTTGPLLTLIPGQGEKVVDNTPSFSATYSDAGSGIDVTQFHAFIDNVDVTASFSVGAPQATFTATAPLPDGIHLFRASIKDLAGNLTELTNLFRVVSAVAEFGTSGGVLAVTDPSRATFGARIDVPVGALDQPVTLWMEHVASPSPMPPGFIRVGPVVDFMPEIGFLQLVTVSLPYDEAAAAALGVPEANLKLLRYDLGTGQWVLLPVSAIDTAANLIQASLTSFAGVQIVAVAETSANAYFVIEGPTGSIQAGTPASITIRAFHPDGTVFDTFAGDVQVVLTGGRGAAGNAVFPETIPATFSTANQGVLTLTDALTFALFGIQTVKATAVADSAILGQTQVGVTPGPPADFVKFAGDGQETLPGSIQAQALVTRVRDAYGNPVQGAQVSYLITSSGASFETRPDNSSPGVPLMNPSTVTVNSLGYAVSPYVRLAGFSTTTNTVTATLMGTSLPVQTFLLTGGGDLWPPLITSPSSGSIVNTTTPIIKGTFYTGDPENPPFVETYYVYLVADGMPAGGSVIHADLSWSILCTPLSNGVHDFFVYTYDQVSSRSSVGVSFSIMIAGTSAPAITTPSQFAQSPTPLIEGTALPNTPITVMFNGAEDGTTRSNGNGDWSYLAAPKPPGVYAVVARAADSTGALVNSNSISIVYQANLAPQITTQSFTTQDLNPTIEGTAPPNVQVLISLFGGFPFFEGSTFSDASGYWTYTFSELEVGTMGDGSPGSSYGVVAQVLLAGIGFSDVSNAITITIVGPDSTPPVISALQPSNGSITNSRRPTISATASDQGGSGLTSLTVTLDGQSVGAIVNVLDANNMTATFTPPSDLLEGPHSVVAQTSDGAGYFASRGATFTIDSVAPEVSIGFAPPSPDEEQKTITVTFSDGGSGLLASSRRVLIDLVDRTGQGAFSTNTWTLTSKFSLGTHSVVAEARDQALNYRQETLSFAVSPPPEPDMRPPSIRLVFPDQVTMFQVEGRMMPVVVDARDVEAGDTGVALVELLVNGEVRASKTGADAQAAFYYVFELSLTGASDLEIVVRATDVAGNQALAADPPLIFLSAGEPTGPVKRFLLNVPAQVEAGQTINVIATPVGSDGVTAVAYQGFLHVRSTQSTPPGLFMPVSATTSIQIPVTLSAVGVGVIMIYDSSDSGISGFAVIEVTPGPPANVDVTLFREERLSPTSTLTEVSALVTDSGGNPVANATVTWEVEFFQNGTSIGVQTLTATTNANGVAFLPGVVVPQNTTSLTAGASVSTPGGGTISNAVSSPVVPKVIFNIELHHQAVEAGMPVSFTITAIRPDTGEIATDFVDMVYVFRYSKFVHGTTTFDGDLQTQGEAAGDMIVVEFTAEDQGVKFVQDGLVLTESRETVLAASTEMPTVTLSGTISLYEFNTTNEVIRVQVMELTDQPELIGGFSNEIVVLPARPARFVSLSFDSLAIRATVILVDRFANPVFLEPVEFGFKLDEAVPATFGSATDRRGQAQGYGPTDIDSSEDHTLVVSAKAPRYPGETPEGETIPTGVPEVSLSYLLAKQSANRAVYVLTGDPPVIELGLNNQPVADVLLRFKGESCERFVSLAFSLDLPAVSSGSSIALKPGTFDSSDAELLEGSLQIQNNRISGTIRNLVPLTPTVDANNVCQTPAAYDLLVTLSELVVDVPNDGRIPANHPDGRLNVGVTTFPDHATIAFFGKTLNFIGSVVPAGNAALTDSNGEMPAGVYIIDAEEVRRTFILNPGLIPQDPSSPVAGTFRVQVMDKDLTPSESLRVKLESVDADGEPIMDPITNQRMNGTEILVPLRTLSASSGTFCTSLVTLPIVAVDAAFRAEEAIGGQPGRVLLRAQSSIPSDGQTEAVIDVVVTYEDGVPVVNAEVTLELAAPHLPVAPTLTPPPPTDAAGRTRGRIKGTVPGTAHVTARVTAPQLDAGHPGFTVVPEDNALLRILFFDDVRMVVVVPGGRLRAQLYDGASVANGFSDSARDAVAMGVEIRVKPEAEDEYRPARFAMIEGLAPEFQFTFQPSIEAFTVPLPPEGQAEQASLLDPKHGMSIIVDDGLDSTNLDRSSNPNRRILMPGLAPWTETFPVTGNTMTWRPSASGGDLRYGANRIRLITLGSGVSVSTARFLNWDQGHDLLAGPLAGGVGSNPDIESREVSGTPSLVELPPFTPPEPQDPAIEIDPAPPLPIFDPYRVELYARQRAIIEFAPEATDQQMSEIFFRYRYYPVGLLKPVNQVEVITFGHPDEVSLQLAGETLIRVSHPERLHLDQQDLAGPVSSEKIPNGLAEKAADGTPVYYSRAHGTYQVLPGESGRGPFAGMRQHFILDTFAGHHMVRRFHPDAPPIPVALIDSGLGTNAADGMTNSVPGGDLPAIRFRNLRLAHGRDREGKATSTIVNLNQAEFNVPALYDVGGKGLGHGTRVAAVVAGTGARFFLGTGDKAVLDIFKSSDQWDDRKGQMITTEFNLRRCLLQAMKEGARIINFSSGTGFIDPNGKTAMDIRKQEETVLDEVSREGVILCFSAGNNLENYRAQLPSGLAPARGTRRTSKDGKNDTPDNAVPLALSITAATIPTDADLEKIWVVPGGGSGGGNNASVAAHGGAVAIPTSSLANNPGAQGTSYSSPQAAGLLADMLWLGDKIRGTPTTPDARRARAMEAILTMEATADDPKRDRNVDFDSMDFDTRLGRSDFTSRNFGYGRINVWKALLSTLNGGLSQQLRTRHIPADPSDPTAPTAAAEVAEYSTLPVKSGTQVTAYGFLLRLHQGNSAFVRQAYKNATAWINIDPLNDQPSVPATLARPITDDASNVGEVTGVAGPIVHANRRILKNQATRIPFTKAEGEATWETLFTLPRISLEANGPKASRLELRRQDEDQTALPFYSIDLNLARLTSNGDSDDSNTSPNNGSDVRFDDFVFEVRVASITTFKSNGFRISKVELPEAGSTFSLEVELLGNTAQAIPGVAVTFSRGTANNDIRINGVVGPVPLNTDLSGRASTTITRTGANLAPVVVTFTLGTEYPQSFTVPVVTQ